MAWELRWTREQRMKENQPHTARNWNWKLPDPGSGRDARGLGVANAESPREVVEAYGRAVGSTNTNWLKVSDGDRVHYFKRERQADGSIRAEQAVPPDGWEDAPDA